MLTDVPTLPCRKHGAPAQLADLEAVAYEIYVILLQDDQFQYRERQKGRKRYVDIGLDYSAVMTLLRVYVSDKDDHPEVFRLIRLIHQTVYSNDEEA